MGRSEPEVAEPNPYETFAEPTSSSPRAEQCTCDMCAWCPECHCGCGVVLGAGLMLLAQLAYVLFVRWLN